MNDSPDNPHLPEDFRKEILSMPGVQADDGEVVARVPSVLDNTCLIGDRWFAFQPFVKAGSDMRRAATCPLCGSALGEEDGLIQCDRRNCELKDVTLSDVRQLRRIALGGRL